MKVRATKKNGLPIRGERSLGARVEIVDTLEYGEEFEAVEEYDGWLYIEGKGWCDAYHTEPVDLSGAGGGGGAASEPVVFTMLITENGREATCNKTYEECLELCNNGILDATVKTIMEGMTVLMKIAGCMINGTTITFLSVSDEPMVMFTPDGIIAEMQ